MTARPLIAAIAAGLALFAGAGTANADGHNIPDPDATWGAPDGAEKRGQSIVPAVQSYVTSSYPAEAGAPVNLWVKTSSYPAQSSYPADPSWPGSGWGVAD